MLGYPVRLVIIEISGKMCGAQRRPRLRYMFLNEVKFNLRMWIMLFTRVFVE